MDSEKKAVGSEIQSIMEGNPHRYVIVGIEPYADGVVREQHRQ